MTGRRAADTWIVNGRLVTPEGVARAALRIADGRIAERRHRAPAAAATIDLRGHYLAPGFIDLHVWGAPAEVARDGARHGATAFLTALGPATPRALASAVAARVQALDRANVSADGATCLGLHLEGPFLNPKRAGVLPLQGMRPPKIGELARLRSVAGGWLRLITLAPELRGAEAAIRWCKAHGVAVALGHTDADAAAARRAVRAGASAVTHLFNAMRPLHQRDAHLVDVALTEPRLTAMVIADGVHLSATALRLAYRMKGARGLALTTDSVRRQARAWKLRRAQGAYRSCRGILAGSALTMIGAVRTMVRAAGVPLHEAVAMASATPARLLGLARTHGSLARGARADLVAFDANFHVRLTMVGGRIVYER